MLLGDLGADVIRIEAPGGSAARRSGPGDDAAGENDPSLQFLAFNRNKRSIALDPADSSDAAVLEKLVASAHFLFESADVASEFGLNYERARLINPHIVYVQITAFGASGPHSELLGNDLTIAAMGGPVALQGVAGKAPVRVSVPQVWRHAGAEAAVAAMAAHGRRLQTGTPQYVDVSAQAAMTWTMLQAMDAAAIQGFDFERKGSMMTAIGVDLVQPCKDGYVLSLPNSGVVRGCREALIEEGLLGADARDMDLNEYDLNIRDHEQQPYSVLDITRALQQFYATRTKNELLNFGIAQNATLAPVQNLHELLALEHLHERNYWEPLVVGPQSVDSPGLWAKLTNQPLNIRRTAPTLDEHGPEIRAELAAQQAPISIDAVAATADKEEAGALPFAGLKVMDIAWVGVGPISSKFLADHGATVVRVESSERPDVLRANPPYKDDEPDINGSQFFGDFNTSKLGLTLDMKSPAALEVARKMLEWADVFIESFAPGAISRMGLSYEDVKAINPGIIMVSTCLMGQTGPAAKLAGYGYHAAAMSGFYEITGHPEDAPSGPWTAYTDTIAPRFCATLLAAALDHRRRTGEGTYIDLAQIETALHFLGPELLDLQVNDRMATRIGNRAVDAAPQGCYRCAGEDNWCAIAVDTDEQWRALCEQIGRPEWVSALDLSTHAQRLARHDEIDASITDWSKSRTSAEVMQVLQAAGVPAGQVQRSSDLLKDPQYMHRGFYRYLDHATMGNIPYAGHAYRIAEYDNGPRFPAPTLGQHSFEVLSDLLGFNDEEVGEAYASGAIN